MAVRSFTSEPEQEPDQEPEDSLQISGAIMAPSDGPSPVQLVDAGHAPHGLGVVARPVRAQDQGDPDHPYGPRFDAGGGTAAALRRLGQRRRPRTRGPGVTARLGRQHPRLLRRRRYVLAGERPPGRTDGLARGQPQPARVRGERPARLEGHLPRQPGRPGDGDRAQGRRRARPPAGALHGRCRRRTVRPRPSAAHPRGGVPRRGLHPGVEGPQGHHPCRALPRPARHRPHGRHAGRRGVRPPRPGHGAHVLDRARRSAGHAAEHPRRGPDAPRRQHADGGRPAKPGATPRRAADPHPQRVGMLRPHHPGAHGARVRLGGACPGAVGPGRPQLDAGPSPGPSRHPHARCPRAGVHGARGRPPAAAWPTRPGILRGGPACTGAGCTGAAAPPTEPGGPPVRRLSRPGRALPP